MCLGIPGKVIEIYESNGVMMGKVDFGGLVKEVCLAYVPALVVGDYTIVHVGFALTQLDEESAQETLALLRQIGSFDEEFGREEASEQEEVRELVQESIEVEAGRHALS
jgi:hydrogenase expression/formation protein HypC